MDYRTALVTGASSGLGRGLATFFAARGVKVYAAARRGELLQTLAAKHPGQVVPFPLDVAKGQQTVDEIAALDQACGGLDLVIANAGVGGDTYGRRISWEKVEKMIDVNVKGAAATLTAALPGMVARGRGHLVGISSIAAFRGLPRSGAYCASKAFVATFLESLRGDLRGTGVQVTCIHPGFVKSEMTATNKFKMPFLLETDAGVEKMGRAILGRRSTFVFPWQMALGARAMRALPNGLYDAAAQKLR